MKNKLNEKTISTVSAVLMLAVFAISVLSVLLGGAKIYSRLTQRDSQAYDSRTCIGYLTAKIRQSDGPVTAEQFGDGDALCFRQSLNGREYLTRVYCHEGWLMELFTLDTEGFEPRDGEKIMPVQALSVDIQGSLLTVLVTDEQGADSRICLSLRSGKEAPYEE